MALALQGRDRAMGQMALEALDVLKREHPEDRACSNLVATVAVMKATVEGSRNKLEYTFDLVLPGDLVINVPASAVQGFASVQAKHTMFKTEADVYYGNEYHKTAEQVYELSVLAIFNREHVCDLIPWANVHQAARLVTSGPSPSGPSTQHTDRRVSSSSSSSNNNNTTGGSCCFLFSPVQLMTSIMSRVDKFAVIIIKNERNSFESDSYDSDFEAHGKKPRAIKWPFEFDACVREDNTLRFNGEEEIRRVWKKAFTRAVADLKRGLAGLLMVPECAKLISSVEQLRANYQLLKLLDLDVWRKLPLTQEDDRRPKEEAVNELRQHLFRKFISLSIWKPATPYESFSNVSDIIDELHGVLDPITRAQELLQDSK